MIRLRKLLVSLITNYALFGMTQYLKLILSLDKGLYVVVGTRSPYGASTPALSPKLAKAGYIRKYSSLNHFFLFRSVSRKYPFPWIA